ncbi:MAG: pyridoxine 5'-phosphate synthase [Deltaproteobacteria bacterium]|nr:pyridoxine 5'-phosphate synthase [Deltaproteobacteria bacterium]MBW2414977.1 pyridoxine 5'-phosphate synthase [Deltaproteobacteria bacterium]
MTKLSVNLNKVALLRNQRDLDLPSVVHAAEVCIAAGADGITVHPRPDERHIRRTDVYDLAGAIDVELNIEGNPFAGFLELVRDVHPAQCTLVPDDPDQRTSDHGWVLVRDGGSTADAKRLGPILSELSSIGIRTSLFMDPDCEQIDAAAALGADRIELYTEPYARAFAGAGRDAALETYRRAGAHAASRGLGINAGHDLNLQNLPAFLALPDVEVLEVSIGHALTADALFMGLDAAVRAYREIAARA